MYIPGQLLDIENGLTYFIICSKLYSVKYKFLISYENDANYVVVANQHVDLTRSPHTYTTINIVTRT